MPPPKRDMVPYVLDVSDDSVTVPRTVPFAPPFLRLVCWAGCRALTVGGTVLTPT